MESSLARHPSLATRFLCYSWELFLIIFSRMPFTLRILRFRLILSTRSASILHSDLQIMIKSLRLMTTGSRFKEDQGTFTCTLPRKPFNTTRGRPRISLRRDFIALVLSLAFCFETVPLHLLITSSLASKSLS